MKKLLLALIAVAGVAAVGSISAGRCGSCAPKCARTEVVKAVPPRCAHTITQEVEDAPLGTVVESFHCPAHSTIVQERE